MFCGKCRNKIEDGAKFCPSCGMQIEHEVLDRVCEKQDAPTNCRISKPIVIKDLVRKTNTKKHLVNFSIVASLVLLLVVAVLFY